MAVMQTTEKQRGMSTATTMVGLLLVVFVSTVAVKLIPIYIEHFNVRASLNSLARNDTSMTEIKARLMRQFSINDVTNVASKNITIKRQGGSKTVTVAYEVRKPMVANIDVVMHFSDSVVLSGQ